MPDRCPKCSRRLTGTEHECETAEERAERMASKTHIGEPTDRWANRPDLD